MSIASGDKVFYYMTRDSLCFLAMTESRYPKRLAFLYLDEIGDLILGALVNEFGNDVSNRILSWLKSRCNVTNFPGLNISGVLR